MTDVDAIVNYDSPGTLAVVRVMLEIGQVLGAFRDRFVIVGGSVPWLLFRGAEPPHLGTLDVDLGLDAKALATDDDYATLVEELEKSGYTRQTAESAQRLKPFQLRREIAGDDGVPVAVVVCLLRPKGKLRKRNKKRVPDLRVQEIYGLEIALSEYVEHEVGGIMPDGRPNAVKLRVASIPAFLVMKGYALVGRDKPKDAYDIYYVIRNFTGGPENLAAECARLLVNDVARKAYEHIAQKFSGEDNYGPATVALFLKEQDALGEMTQEQVRVDAFRQVRSWLKALGLLGDVLESPPKREISLHDTVSPADETSVGAS